MTGFRGTTIALLTVLVIGGAAGSAAAAGTVAHHVVDATDIQARIDQQMDREDADREAIQKMLQRPEVRDIAGRAGLDMKQAGAAAAVLSGAELKDLAAQASEIDAGLSGGSNVVLSTTAIIIILLIIIIVAS